MLDRAFPGRGLSAADVVGAQAGIRPLVGSDGGASTPRLARGADLAPLRRRGRDRGRQADDLPAHGREGRRGARPRHLVAARPPDREHPDRAGVRRPGAARRLAAAGVAADGGRPAAARLRGRGGRAGRARRRPTAALAAPIVPGQPPILAEVVFAARHEQALGVADVLARRTRLLLLDGRGARAAAPAVADLMAGRARLVGGRARARARRLRRRVGPVRAAGARPAAGRRRRSRRERRARPASRSASARRRLHLPLEVVEAVVLTPPITPVPGTPAQLVGLFNHHGAIYPAVQPLAGPRRGRPARGPGPRRPLRPLRGPVRLGARPRRAARRRAARRRGAGRARPGRLRGRRPAPAAPARAARAAAAQERSCRRRSPNG